MRIEQPHDIPVHHRQDPARTAALLRRYHRSGWLHINGVVHDPCRGDGGIELAALQARHLAALEAAAFALREQAV